MNQFQPLISIDKAFHECLKQHEELNHIYGFIDLPEHVKEVERTNSAILKNYYANALDHNLVDIKTVKYILQRNLRPNGINERNIEAFALAQEELTHKLDEPISIEMVVRLHQLLFVTVYREQQTGANNGAHAFHFQEKLDHHTESELESFFDFLNNDTEFHPLIQGWMLHFRLLALPIFPESKLRIAMVLHNFWLRKHKMDIDGLLCTEHELYLQKLQYQELGMPAAGVEVHLNEQIAFGLSMHRAQLSRIKDLLKSYFRKQVEFDKLNPRQKNIMNYVFERGYKVKEIDDRILNKRQKLIIYIIQHRGFISTKELVNEFDCNRKTIQRDFTLLLDLGLVKSIGAGAGLKYCINLQEKTNPQLESFQADFVQKPSAQDEAYNSSSW